ncbi:NACHT, LRR and PYD domains-containing protein 12 [Microtus ochrogaster]|uniref:NACHT, LRR and PYD domains-containing protein 12 n=1 Tax=Microtus ochrogaster TaxID=79684 RepID=A0A8J6GXP0_MICOH|nr:NACHT, LRR and PYD domains-containing protein 12 [Microtus ochrogaster]
MAALASRANTNWLMRSFSSGWTDHTASSHSAQLSSQVPQKVQRMPSMDRTKQSLLVNTCLRELDLSFNDLGDRDLQLLGEGLWHPACRLQKLWLDSCGLTSKACEDLSFILGTSQTLMELYLTKYALGDTGVQLLCKSLRHPGCKLRVLWLFGMNLNKMTHRRLAALRVTKPYLDTGCSALLQHQNGGDQDLFIPSDSYNPALDGIKRIKNSRSP